MKYIIFLLLSICCYSGKAESKSMERIAIEQFSKAICNPEQWMCVKMNSERSCNYLHLSAMLVAAREQSIVVYSTGEGNNDIAVRENEKQTGYFLLIDSTGATYSYLITETQNSYRLYKMLPGRKLKLKKAVPKRCSIN